jgi:hypothetical protein
VSRASAKFALESTLRDRGRLGRMGGHRLHIRVYRRVAQAHARSCRVLHGNQGGGDRRDVIRVFVSVFAESYLLRVMGETRTLAYLPDSSRPYWRFRRVFS